jgi:site-specific recombinase XerD
LLFTNSHHEESTNPVMMERRRIGAWRFMRRATMGTGVVGVAGRPRGLRHAFAVGALQAGVPLNVVQRWLGHARMSTTSHRTVSANFSRLLK